MSKPVTPKPKRWQPPVDENQSVKTLEGFAIWLGKIAADMLNSVDADGEAIKKFQSKRHGVAVDEAFRLGMVHGRITGRNEMFNELAPVISAHIRRTGAIHHLNANKEVDGIERQEIERLNAELVEAIPKPSLRYREIATRISASNRTLKESRVRYVIEGPRKGKKAKN